MPFRVVSRREADEQTWEPVFLVLPSHRLMYPPQEPLRLEVDGATCTFEHDAPIICTRQQLLELKLESTPGDKTNYTPRRDSQGNYVCYWKEYAPSKLREAQGYEFSWSKRSYEEPFVYLVKARRVRVRGVGLYTIPDLNQADQIAWTYPGKSYLVDNLNTPRWVKKIKNISGSHDGAMNLLFIPDNTKNGIESGTLINGNGTPEVWAANDYRSLAKSANIGWESNSGGKDITTYATQNVIGVGVDFKYTQFQDIRASELFGDYGHAYWSTSWNSAKLCAGALHGASSSAASSSSNL